MKKIVFFIIIIVILMLVVIIVGIGNYKMAVNKIKSFNLQFEEYLGQTFYGADVLTIINKAIDNNETNGIEKDDNGFYIENAENSIKVEITLLSTDADENVNEISYQMETLEKARTY